MDQDKLDKIAEDVSEIKVGQAKHEIYLERNTKSLEEHMRRTDVLEELHRDNQSRIERLEEPKKAWKLVLAQVVKLGASASAIAAMLKLISYLNQ